MSQQQEQKGSARDISDPYWSVSYARTILQGAVAAGRELGRRNPCLAYAAATGDAEWALLPSEDAAHFRELLDSLYYHAEVPVASQLEAGPAYWLEFAVEAAAMRGLAAADGSQRAPVTADDESVAEELVARMIGLLVGSECSLPGAQEYMDAAAGPGEIHVLSASDERAEVRTSWRRDFATGAHYQWCVLREADQVHLGIRRIGQAKVQPLMSADRHAAARISELLASAIS